MVMTTINVIGLGYIGLPTALMFAANGTKIIGTDCDEVLIDTLKKGVLTFEENGIVELFEKAISNGIEFTTEYQECKMYIVAVPTPYNQVSKKIDPQYVISAVNSIIKVARNGAIIIIESTISPGTIDKFIRPLLLECCSKKSIHIVHAPERILPGNMLYELENNSRTIGADSKEIGQKVKREYEKFCKSEIVLTDIRTAEMTKVVENTYRDINIAFANELCKICNYANMDVYEIIKISNKHPRVNILQPGPGVGGHCISVDPWFLVGDYPDLTNIILTARKINASMPEYVLLRLRTIMKEHGIKDISKIGLYGLAYKEDIDDTRESPTLQILEKMGQHLAYGVKVYDPLIKKSMVENQYFDFDEFLKDIEIIVVMVAHSHIKNNINKIADKIVLDTRNIINLDNVYKLT